MPDAENVRVLDPDATLDAVMALWREAKAHEDTQHELEDEARNQQYMAEEKYEEAEQLWTPLLNDHPEWRDALVMSMDPREVEH